MQSDWGRDYAWKKAIVHVDGDSFFASVEQAVHPEWKGKPVVTGKERGIVSAASIEAKKLGITRGVALWDVSKICPEAIIVPSDYETYSIFSKRMFAIMRRFTSDVEAYSIDEGFADITGLQRPLHMNYREIAKQMKETIERELDISVSVGLAPSKTLAKIASDYDKPSGCVTVPGCEIEHFLKDVPVGDVWGIGARTTSYLQKFGIKTALQFAQQSPTTASQRFTKPHIETWQELNGHSAYPVVPEEKSTYASIGKIRTFTPPSNKREFLFAQLLKNLENACIKTRRYHLASQRIVVYLRFNNFQGAAIEGKLSRPSAWPQDMVPLVRQLFDKLYQPRIEYRATSITLTHLINDDSIQRTLFEEPLAIERTERVWTAVDTLAKKYGKHTVHLAGSDVAHQTAQHEHQRGDLSWRKQNRLKGESNRKHLRVPVCSQEVT